MTSDRIKAFYLLSAKLDKLEKTPAADEKNPSPEYLQLCKVVDELRAEYVQYVKEINDPEEAAKADEVKTIEAALGVIGRVLSMYVLEHSKEGATKDGPSPKDIDAAMGIIIEKLREAVLEKTPENA